MTRVRERHVGADGAQQLEGVGEQKGRNDDDDDEAEDKHEARIREGALHLERKANLALKVAGEAI